MLELPKLKLLTLAFRLYGYAIYLSFRIALAGLVSEGVKLFVTPVGYWRFVPNAFVALFCPPRARVLDVGSPKLPSLYLTQVASEVHACDLNDPKIFSRWGRIASSLGIANYKVSYQDARKLDYPDEYFDLVYSISVIEHIPDDGDTLALLEFARVLKAGGKVVVEVPYRRKPNTIYAQYDSKGAALQTPEFYERHYDARMLTERLEVPGLKIIHKVIMCESLPIDPWISAQQLPRLLRIPILPLEPWLAAVNMRMNPDDSRGNPIAALVVYEKQGHRN